MRSFVNIRGNSFFPFGTQKILLVKLNFLHISSTRVSDYNELTVFKQHVQFYLPFCCLLGNEFVKCLIFGMERFLSDHAPRLRTLQIGFISESPTLTDSSWTLLNCWREPTMRDSVFVSFILSRLVTNFERQGYKLRLL